MSESDKEKRIKFAKSWAKKGPRLLGRQQYMNHLNGKKLTYKQAVWAKCYMCTDGWDIEKGCSDPTCPLVPLCPYNTKSKNTSEDEI